MKKIILFAALLVVKCISIFFLMIYCTWCGTYISAEKFDYKPENYVEILVKAILNRLCFIERFVTSELLPDWCIGIKYNILMFSVTVKFPDIRNPKAFYMLMLFISNVELGIYNITWLDPNATTAQDDENIWKSQIINSE